MKNRVKTNHSTVNNCASEVHPALAEVHAKFWAKHKNKVVRFVREVCWDCRLESQEKSDNVSYSEKLGAFMTEYKGEVKVERIVIIYKSAHY